MPAKKRTTQPPRKQARRQAKEPKLAQEYVPEPLENFALPFRPVDYQSGATIAPSPPVSPRTNPSRSPRQGTVDTLGYRTSHSDSVVSYQNAMYPSYAPTEDSPFPMRGYSPTLPSYTPDSPSLGSVYSPTSPSSTFDSLFPGGSMFDHNDPYLDGYRPTSPSYTFGRPMPKRKRADDDDELIEGVGAPESSESVKAESDLPDLFVWNSTEFEPVS